MGFLYGAGVLQGSGNMVPCQTRGIMRMARHNELVFCSFVTGPEVESACVRKREHDGRGAHYAGHRR